MRQELACQRAIAAGVDISCVLHRAALDLVFQAVMKRRDVALRATYVFAVPSSFQVIDRVIHDGRDVVNVTC